MDADPSQHRNSTQRREGGEPSPHFRRTRMKATPGLLVRLRRPSVVPTHLCHPERGSAAERVEGSPEVRNGDLGWKGIPTLGGFFDSLAPKEQNRSASCEGFAAAHNGPAETPRSQSCREVISMAHRNPPGSVPSWGGIVDSQDGCRYTLHDGRCVATGFQPVGDCGPGRAWPGLAVPWHTSRLSGSIVPRCTDSRFLP